MPRDEFDDDQAWLGRESLFRKKLNQLRTTGRIESRPQVEAAPRAKEMERSQYLANIDNLYRIPEPDDLQKVTLLDSLTEVYNNATITRIMNDEIRRGKRYKYASVILMVSPDNLQDVFLKLGQLAVDSIYKGTAAFLMNTIRDVDIPGRISPEAFVVICPNTDLKGGSVLAERIRNNILQKPISDLGQNHTVTASVAVVEYPSQCTSVEEAVTILANSIDQARAKGGDCVVIAELATEK